MQTEISTSTQEGAGWQLLTRLAREARSRAHCPFSRFAVGAVLEDEQGRTFTGCNIENASYGLTMCAERVAIFKAISEGAGTIVRVVVTADTKSPAPPCGACRQLLWEFCPQAQLLMVNLGNDRLEMTIAELLPKAFDAQFL